MEAAALGLLPPATSVITFTVLGKAQTAGSKRAFLNKKTGRAMVVDDNPQSKPWKAIISAAGHDAMQDRPLLDGPLMVRFAFFQQRPQSHYGTGRNRSAVKASAPMFPTTRPDVLKLARAAEDALTGVCWRDDALIVDERLQKFYGEPARCEIEIAEIHSAWGQS